MAVNCGLHLSWKLKVKPNLVCHSDIHIGMPDILVFVSPWCSKMTKLRPLKCEGHLATLWLWPLTYKLEKWYFIWYFLVKCSVEIWSRYSHYFPRCLPDKLPPKPTSLKHEYRGQYSKLRCSFINSRPLRPKGYCRHLRLSVCPSVRLSVFRLSVCLSVCLFPSSLLTQ